MAFQSRLMRWEANLRGQSVPNERSIFALGSESKTMMAAQKPSLL